MKTTLTSPPAAEIRAVMNPDERLVAAHLTFPSRVSRSCVRCQVGSVESGPESYAAGVAAVVGGITSQTYRSYAEATLGDGVHCH
jgi:hypothetical protein